MNASFFAYVSFRDELNRLFSKCCFFFDQYNYRSKLVLSFYYQWPFSIYHIPPFICEGSKDHRSLIMKRAWKTSETINVSMPISIYSIYCSEDCAVKQKRKECLMMLRCRQRCTNEYPVPNGFVKECTGKFEGDTCEVGCPEGFVLVGDAMVQCKNGEWVNLTGEDASSRCESQLWNKRHGQLEEIMSMFLLPYISYSK